MITIIIILYEEGISYAETDYVILDFRLSPCTEYSKFSLG